MEATSRGWYRVYLGVALTTLATLLLELALTRIFSVVFYYHFAFLAISIALFGLGAGGVCSYAASAWRGRLFEKLGWLALANGALVVASLAFLLTRRGELGYGTLAAMYFASALPFFMSGTVVSLVIAETIERVNRVYFADLLGAAAGCLMLIPLLDSLGGPNTVIASGALFAASGAVWFGAAGAKRRRNAAAAAAVAVAALAVLNARRPLIDVRYAKGKLLSAERFVKWNSFSRVAVEKDKNGSGQLSIVIDADAATGVPNFDFDHLSDRDRDGLLYRGPGLPYVLRPGAKALIIGAGGGWDIARALASGSRDVTGVEINPIIANDIMRDRFAAYSRRLYLRPEVHIFVEDGRSFVRRSTESYEVIQATLVDTWASTAAGAFALSENTLYTTEAFEDYLRRLDDDGLLVFTRWGLDPPRESLRLLALAREALERLGQREAWRNCIVVRERTPGQLAGWGATDTVLISRTPFATADLDRLRAALAHGPFQPVYMPDRRIDTPFTSLLRAANPGAFERRYEYDVSPVGDNRPFFFYTVQPRDLLDFAKRVSRLSADYNVNRAVATLFELLLVSLLASSVILALPRVALGSRLPADRGVLRFLWYFIFIGVGYIEIQVALVQKFVLFLGHPTYALAVIIFSMLVSSGAGSYWSSRALRDSDGRLEAALALVAVLVAALAFAVSPVLGLCAGLPRAVKSAISVLMVAPAGFVMGMPFPSGLRRIEGLHAPSVRWAWSLNAAASVLGSVCAMALAICLGLREAMLAGGALYLCALGIVRLTRRAAPRSAESARIEMQAHYGATSGPAPGF
jgi:hypothetical protein